VLVWFKPLISGLSIYRREVELLTVAGFSVRRRLVEEKRGLSALRTEIYIAAQFISDMGVFV